MNGVRTVWIEEVNFRIEIGGALVTIFLGAWLRLSPLEWIIVILCIGSVICAEMVNTAIEDLCNKIEPRHDPIIGKIKDIMAGFVFLASLGAMAMGILLLAHHFAIF